MDNITELADLAEEQEICNKTEKIIMDLDEEFSESECELTEQEADPDIIIEEIPYKKEKRYLHSFYINKHYYRCIIGTKGKTLKQLCSDTKTVIHVSKKKKHVVIIGSVQKRIIHAKRQIDDLIEKSKIKTRFTHFISIPTNTNDIKQNYLKFKENILRNYNTEVTGFHEDMFQKPEKLHLTICMLHLLENNDQLKAIEALNNCKKDIIEPIINDNGPINIEFNGLMCMENNPAKAKVLYAKVIEKTGFLQKMSDEINDYFLHQGLTRKQYDNVTLHMTIINTFYLKKKKQKHFRKNFDATNILKDHANTYFGQINLSTIHLSKLTAKSADGYFAAAAVVKF